MTLADRLHAEFSRERLAAEAPDIPWESYAAVLEHEAALVERVIARAQEIAGEDDDLTFGSAVMHATLRSFSAHTGTDETCDQCRAAVKEFAAALRGETP